MSCGLADREVMATDSCLNKVVASTRCMACIFLMEPFTTLMAAIYVGN